MRQLIGVSFAVFGIYYVGLIGGESLAGRGIEVVYGGGHIGLMGAVADGTSSRSAMR